MDSSIKSATIKTHNFVPIFLNYKSVKHVFFNGTKAEKEFKKRVLPKLINLATDIEYVLLPSTSPANTNLSKGDKIKQWSKIKSILI